MRRFCMDKTLGLLLPTHAKRGICNMFTVAPPLFGSSGGGSYNPGNFVWNPADSYEIAFSNNNQTVTMAAPGYNCAVRGVQGHGAGRHYCEQVMDQPTTYMYGWPFLGLAPATTPLDGSGVGGYYGVGTGGVVTQASATINVVNPAYWPGLQAGDNLGFFLDSNLGMLWVRYNGGAWVGGGNPDTNSSPSMWGSELQGVVIFPMTQINDGGNFHPASGQVTAPILPVYACPSSGLPWASS